MERINVTQVGDGDAVVFVHGSFGWGTETWSKQLPLADGYRLLLVDRRGFGASPGPDVGNWGSDAADIAAILPHGAHVVGHSYGGVSALLAAARVPAAVRSLTVIEPPALGLVRRNEAVEEFIARVARAKEAAVDADDYRRKFFASFGFPPPRGTLEPGDELRAGLSSWRERPPWDALIPLDELRTASFPVLVVRGAWDNAPEEARAVGMCALHAVCDVLVDALAADTATFTGAAHNPQALGEPFNERLRAFWSAA